MFKDNFMRMDICLSADDNYAKYMGTTIASILSNSKENEEIYFHLLDIFIYWMAE